MLGVGYVTDRLAGVLDPVSGGAVGMIERRGAQLDIGTRRQGFTGAKIMEAYVAGENRRRHRKERRRHELRQRFVKSHLRQQMSGP